MKQDKIDKTWNDGLFLAQHILNEEVAKLKAPQVRELIEIVKNMSTETTEENNLK